MGSIDSEVFACIDCEMTGLDPQQDRVIEVACALFKGGEILESFESLIDPGVPIPEASIKIHHITDMMVKGQPKIDDVLPTIISMVRKRIIIGHGIAGDLALLRSSAERATISFPIGDRTIDTFRLARLYGESPTNSLNQLRQHFNIEAEGSHRALGDVKVNVQVFHYLAKRYKTTNELFNALSKPIQLKAMPLGKYKGRPFAELPLNFLQWAVRQQFDEDLLYSIKLELGKRKSSSSFNQAFNPFNHLD